LGGYPSSLMVFMVLFLGFFLFMFNDLRFWRVRYTGKLSWYGKFSFLWLYVWLMN
jgi:hypothetical protein